MKILKPGKVEMRKFVCPNCGCIFAESKKKLCELSYGFRVSCPQNGCGYEFTDDGEHYEEPTQDVENDRKRLQDLIHEWETCHFGGIPAVAQFFLEHGVTFREG